MTQTSYVNPNGLPRTDRSLRRAISQSWRGAVIRDLPEYDTHAHPLDPLRAQGDAEFNKLIGRFLAPTVSRPASSALPATICRLRNAQRQG